MKMSIAYHRKKCDEIFRKGFAGKKKINASETVAKCIFCHTIPQKSDFFHEK
jgi:hypothetical protein